MCVDSRYTVPMSRKLTFIHAADLHFGAPFRGLRALSDVWANRLLTAIPEAYDRLIDAAVSRRVDFVIIAGDIFDGARASYGDYLKFFEGLKRLDGENIPVYLVTGNHDPYTSWQHDFFAFPPNTTMFSADKPDFALFERDGEPLCLLGGRGYYNQAWPADVDIAEGVTRRAAEAALEETHPGASSAPFSIGVLHTGLDIDMAKAPTDPHALLHAGMDYWALGHIHMRHVFPSRDDPRVVFPGCIQGRDINETGERGAFLVTLTRDAPNKLEFIPTASVVWQRMDVDVGDCMTLPDITDKIMRALFQENGKAHCEEMCARITLTGASPLHAVLERPGVLEDLRKHINDSYALFFCDALIDATRQPRDKEALRHEKLFPAVFLNVARSLRADPAEELSYLQEEFLNKNLQLPNSSVRHIDELAEAAENHVLDLLAKEEER